MGRLISPARPSLWQFGASWPRNKTNALPQTNYDYGYRCYSRLPSRFPSSPSVSISSEHLRAMKPALRMPLCALRKAHHGGANRPLGEMDGSRTSMGMPWDANHGDLTDHLMTKMTKIKGSVGQNQRISECTIQWSVGIPC